MIEILTSVGVVVALLLNVLKLKSEGDSRTLWRAQTDGKLDEVLRNTASLEMRLRVCEEEIQRLKLEMTRLHGKECDV